MRRLEFLVDSNHQALRLDVFLSENQNEFSRSHLKKLIEKGHASVNNFPAQAKYRIKTGDKIILNIYPPSSSGIEAESIPLTIIYEDEAMLVVNKPAGMVVHPAPGHVKGTLVNALLNHCSDLSGIGGVERPGIVHRLDKDTSGVVLIAKNIETSIGRHKTNRKKMTATMDQGRQAETRYEVIETLGHFSYLRLFPKTGRTHQIRVHLASIHHPVLGDSLYGGKIAEPYLKIPRQALHAHRVEINHPLNKQPLVFEAPVPPDINNYLAKYRQNHN